MPYLAIIPVSAIIAIVILLVIIQTLAWFGVARRYRW